MKKPLDPQQPPSATGKVRYGQKIVNAAAAKAQAEQKRDAERQTARAAELTDRKADMAAKRAQVRQKQSDRQAERARLEGPPRLGPDFDPYGKPLGRPVRISEKLSDRLGAAGIPTTMPSKEEARQLRELTGKAPRPGNETSPLPGMIADFRKKMGFKNGGCVMAGRGGKYKGMM